MPLPSARGEKPNQPMKAQQQQPGGRRAVPAAGSLSARTETEEEESISEWEEERQKAKVRFYF